MLRSGLDLIIARLLGEIVVQGIVTLIEPAVVAILLDASGWNRLCKRFFVEPMTGLTLHWERHTATFITVGSKSGTNAMVFRRNNDIGALLIVERRLADEWCGWHSMTFHMMANTYSTACLFLAARLIVGLSLLELINDVLICAQVDGCLFLMPAFLTELWNLFEAPICLKVMCLVIFSNGLIQFDHSSTQLMSRK